MVDVSKYIFPTYYDRVQPLKESFSAQRINGDLQFQMAMYFNAFLLPVYTVIEVGTLYWKVER